MPRFDVTFVPVSGTASARKVRPQRLSTKTVRDRGFWRAIGRLETMVSELHSRKLRADIITAAEDLPDRGIRSGDIVARGDEPRRP